MNKPISYDELSWIFPSSTAELSAIRKSMYPADKYVQEMREILGRELTAKDYDEIIVV